MKAVACSADGALQFATNNCHFMTGLLPPKDYKRGTGFAGDGGPTFSSTGSLADSPTISESRRCRSAKIPATMDRQTLLDHLALAERDVSEGEIHVARQRELVAKMEQGGHETGLARALLQKFEELLAIHKGDRDRLRGEVQK